MNKDKVIGHRRKFPYKLRKSIIKIKQNRSLNTTSGLLAKIESSYVTTCFGLHLRPLSGYDLVALRVLYNMHL